MKVLDTPGEFEMPSVVKRGAPPGCPSRSAVPAAGDVWGPRRLGTKTQATPRWYCPRRAERFQHVEYAEYPDRYIQRSRRPGAQHELLVERDDVTGAPRRPPRLEARPGGAAGSGPIFSGTITRIDQGETKSGVSISESWHPALRTRRVYLEYGKAMANAVMNLPGKPERGGNPIPCRTSEIPRRPLFLPRRTNHSPPRNRGIRVFSTPEVCLPFFWLLRRQSPYAIDSIFPGRRVHRGRGGAPRRGHHQVFRGEPVRQGLLRLPLE
jgi:hypothetical protein